MAEATGNTGGKVRTLSVRCPECGGITRWKDNPFRPFCSERCKLIDLGAWAEEKYSVPSVETPTPGEDQGED